MSAPDSLLYEYAVIRYVPNVEREEFVNIGLIMMSKRNKWLKALVILNEARIRALYPNVDLECLQNQSRLFELMDVPSREIPVEEKYRWLTAVKSACLQVSPSHPGIIAISESGTDVDNISKKAISTLMEGEFERLFASLVL